MRLWHSLAAGAGVVAALGLAGSPVLAQQKEIKIGLIFDQTGPFAGGGSVATQLGSKYAIDIINERGGVEGYKIVPVFADAQSKADVAVNEAERLINEQKVDMLMGVYSSAHCVPLSAKVDAAKKFWWATVCISSAVFRNKNLKYVFRSHAHSDQWGEASCDMLNAYAKSKLGIEPKDLKVAVIHEDGPYGVGVALGNENRCKQHGIQIVHKEGYAATATDLSALVTKLRRARADVLLHTGYNPDITLFLRQAKEAGLKFKALIGHGAGYAQFDRLSESFGKDVDLIYNIDTVGSHLLDPKQLKVKDAAYLIDEMVKRYRADVNPKSIPAHVSIGFANTWAFVSDVLPRAIKKHGGIDAEALRQAALETDIPDGGTLQGYGVKFYPPGHEMAGQNERAYPVVMQFVGGETKVVWPKEVATSEPLMPLPQGHAYAQAQ
ncbi:MAG: ABC transporter substrate-binding protein [Hyphomicrobiaceae bacterium]|jgi:branched-chain amino acid transport system substrate-binding protein